MTKNKNKIVNFSKKNKRKFIKYVLKKVESLLVNIADGLRMKNIITYASVNPLDKNQQVESVRFDEVIIYLSNDSVNIGTQLPGYTRIHLSVCILRKNFNPDCERENTTRRRTEGAHLRSYSYFGTHSKVHDYDHRTGVRVQRTYTL